MGSTAEKSESDYLGRDFLDWASSLDLLRINCKYIQDYILYTFLTKKFYKYFQSTFERATNAFVTSAVLTVSQTMKELQAN